MEASTHVAGAAAALQDADSRATMARAAAPMRRATPPPMIDDEKRLESPGYCPDNRSHG